MDKINVTSYCVVDALYELNEVVMDGIKTIIKNNDLTDVDEFLEHINSTSTAQSNFLKIEFKSIRYSTVNLMIESILWCKRNNYRW